MIVPNMANNIQTINYTKNILIRSGIDLYRAYFISLSYSIIPNNLIGLKYFKCNSKFIISALTPIKSIKKIKVNMKSIILQKSYDSDP